MRYFLDTEFIEDGNTIDLISIGILAEDGREYYAINYNCDFEKANNWVFNNVLVHLPKKPEPKLYPFISAFKASPEYKQGWRTKDLIAIELQEFFEEDDGKIELWGYYCAYDWVAFCQVWGKMIDLPKGFPMHCNDVKQYAQHLGNPMLPRQEEGRHHALNDAKHVQKQWKFLRDRRFRNGIEYV